MGSGAPTFHKVALRVSTVIVVAFLVGRLGFSITWVGLMTGMFAYDAHRKQKAHHLRHRVRAFRQAHDPDMLNMLFQKLPDWINFSDVEHADFVRHGSRRGRPSHRCGRLGPPPAVDGGVGRRGDMRPSHHCGRHAAWSGRRCRASRRHAAVFLLRVRLLTFGRCVASQVSDMIQQMWPVAKLATENMLKTILSGVFVEYVQGKGALLSKLGLVRMDLGHDPPQITGINVHKVGEQRPPCRGETACRLLRGTCRQG